MEKIKKGSQKFRKAIEKDQDFINTASMNRWKKTLQDDNLDQETIRNCFKMTHWNEFTAKERDSILKLLTRKTLLTTSTENLPKLSQTRQGKRRFLLGV